MYQALRNTNLSNEKQYFNYYLIICSEKSSLFFIYSGFGLSRSCKMSAIYFYLWQLLVIPTLRNIWGTKNTISFKSLAIINTCVITLLWNLFVCWSDLLTQKYRVSQWCYFVTAFVEIDTSVHTTFIGSTYTLLFLLKSNALCIKLGSSYGCFL